MNQTNRIVADFARSIQRSPIRAMYDKAEKLENAGKELIRLEIGEPDFDTPQNMINAGKKSLDRGETHYTPNKGIFELREAISEKLARENGIEADPESQIVVTAGAMEALYLSMLVTVNRGDEILIPDPGWPNFLNQALMVGGRPVRYHLIYENKFQPQLEELKELVGAKTKGIVINTPSNPLGTVLDRNTLEGIADIASDGNLLVYSDETYEKLLYGDNEHFSVGSLDQVRDQVFTILSFSKSYAMTGWRVGYVVGWRNIIRELTKAKESTSACTCSISQRAALEALKSGENSVRRMRKIFEDRKNLVVREIKKTPLVWCMEPQGTFYVFLNVSELGSSLEVAEKLLEKKGVVTVPGSGFGKMGEGFLRLSFANSKEKIVEGFKRIRSFIEDYA